MTRWIRGRFDGGACAAAPSVGAVAGATFESYVDALAGERLRLDNELLNFLNTAVGGLVAAALFAAAS